MKSFKHILLGFSLIGMFAACSSENGIAPESAQPDNRQWTKIDFTMGVDQGNPSSRAIGDLDGQDLPKGAYPEKLGIYMHGYDKGEVKGTLTLSEEGVDNGGKADFYYYVDEAKGTVSLKSTPESQDELTVEIAPEESNLKQMKNDEMQMFFFASQKAINNVKFPEIDPNTNDYEDLFPNAHEEFGDKLFCTDGYIFQWKDSETIGLFLIINNSNQDIEVREIQEISSWKKGDWDITMKRLTSCITIRLMIIDSYVTQDGTTIHKNIEGMDKSDIGFEEGLRLTNDAFRKYVEKNHSDLELQADFSVENLLVRKKVFQNFPVTFNWENGLQAGRNDERGNLYLCNLDYPAWVDDVVDYEHGSNNVHALTATCDNEPFVAADSKMIYGVDLVLFMGFGKRDAGDKEQGGDYDKLATLTIPFGSAADVGSNPYHVTPNTHTYLYVGITLEDLVNLYRIMNGIPNPKTLETRSVSDIANITISPEQVIVTSEPYIAE